MSGRPLIPLLAAIVSVGCGETTIEREVLKVVEVPTTIIKEVPVYPDAGTVVPLDCTKQIYEAQPEILARTSITGKEVITVDGKQFKDLNDNGTLDPYEDWRLLELCRARDLASKMTVPQKVGLMSEGGTLGNGTTDGVIPDDRKARIVEQHVRQALIRFNDNITAQMLAVYINNLQELAEAQPLGIPVVITADPVHFVGFNTDRTTGANTISVTKNVSHWPLPMGLGAINDAAVTRQYGDAVRKEFMAMGFRWQLGPMADLGTEPRWARVGTTFGENAIAVAKHVRATVEAFQGSPNGNLRNGIAATAKHFPGAGPDENGMDSHSYPGRYNVFPGNNFIYHTIPFEAAFDVGAAAIMPCYSIYKDQFEWDPYQVPSGFSYDLITRLAKERLGFTGMVTGDWGAAGGSAFNLEALTPPERAAMWLKAGSHQYGSDSSSNFQLAYDQGLITEADINGAAEKILEMSLKLGIFENPYVDPELTPTITRSDELLTNGFEAQKRAIVLLRNGASSSTRLLPLVGSRSQPDANGDGTIKVYFDGVVDSIVGTDAYEALLGDYDYTAPGAEGVRPIVQADNLADADVAVIRITSRRGVYFGLDNGVPLSFDGPFQGLSNDNTIGSAIVDRNKVINAFRVRDGFKNHLGEAIAPQNPNLKIVLVMNMDRPGIVKPFIHGLKSLDMLPDVPESYPLVSDEANIYPTVTKGVDAFLVDFGAYDRAVLDFVFDKNPPIVGYDVDNQPIRGHGRARLPIEIPSTDAEVEAQFEDLPSDTRTPTYRIGSGSNL